MYNHGVISDESDTVSTTCSVPKYHLQLPPVYIVLSHDLWKFYYKLHMTNEMKLVCKIQINPTELAWLVNIPKYWSQYVLCFHLSIFWASWGLRFNIYTDHSRIYWCLKRIKSNLVTLHNSKCGIPFSY